MSTPRNKNRNKEGIVLVSTLTALAVMALIAGSFLVHSMTSLRQMSRWKESDECFLLAQSAMEKAKYDIFTKFKQHFNSAPLAGSSEKFNWFQTATEGAVGISDPYIAPQDEPFGDGTVTVTIEDALETRSPGYRAGPYKLKLKVDAELHDMRHTITEYVLYALEASEVFDYAYFINNFGWFWGSQITANGDVRANGDFSCRYDPYINGDVKACINPDNGALGRVLGSWRSRSLSYWQSSGPERARPGNPPSPAYLDEWPMGYNGDPRGWEGLEPLEMPYLGDLSEYEYVASNQNGTISQDGVVIVSNVYTGPGPNPLPSATADDGSLILVGTSDKPIVVDGPVVVRGDLVIKGNFTGMGTVYAGRNVHIVGDLVSQNHAEWPKPDADPETTAEINTTRDLVVLACKGNVLFGDYTSSTWYSKVKSYIRPSFTSSYETDASDYELGYDSDWNPANGYRFNGDYTALDGGQKVDEYGNNTDRRYYESSICRTTVHAVAQNEMVDRVDAVVYNNHLISGYTGGIKVNGCLIGRDEAIIFNGYPTMNWDIRVGSRSKDAVDIDVYPPRVLAPPERLYWQESSG